MIFLAVNFMGCIFHSFDPQFGRLDEVILPHCYLQTVISLAINFKSSTSSEMCAIELTVKMYRCTTFCLFVCFNAAFYVSIAEIAGVLIHIVTHFANA